jgi:hypothetical protein
MEWWTMYDILVMVIRLMALVPAVEGAITSALLEIHGSDPTGTKVKTLVSIGSRLVDAGNKIVNPGEGVSS